MTFMPIVLAAGVGSRITELTKHYPKALLPVGNYPTVYYCLAMLQRHGFSDAIVVIPRSYEKEFRTALIDKCGLKIKLTFETIPDTMLGDCGTAETLRNLRNRIVPGVDLLVVSGDLITDFSLPQMINMYHKNSATFIMLLSTVKENRDLPVPACGKVKQKGEEDVFGFSNKDNRLLYMDAVEKGSQIELPTKTFMRYPAMNLRSDITDCHLYLMRRWVLDYLYLHSDCEGLASIRLDLLPQLVEKQFPSVKCLTKSRKKWMFWDSEPNPDGEPNRLLPPNKDNDVYSFAEITHAMKEGTKYIDMAKSISAGWLYKANTPELQLTADNDVIRCYAFIQDSGYCVRNNTVSAYCEANSQISKFKLPDVGPLSTAFIHPSVRVPKTTQVGPDCFIGSDCKIGEKVMMKKSAVGTNCILQDKTKITNSIIMDDVKFGESCMVANSIVCSGAVLGSKCEIKDSIVTPSMNIQPLSKHINELVSSDADRLADE